jgi:hypothetical protein
MLDAQSQFCVLGIGPTTMAVPKKGPLEAAIGEEKHWLPTPL